MTEEKKLYRRHPDIRSGPDCFHLYRPLLSLTKKEIYEACKKYAISFTEDASNTDCSVSIRNAVRKHYSGICTMSHYLSYQKLLCFLEELSAQKNTYQVEISPLISPRESVHEYYKVGNISTYVQLKQLLDFCGIYKNITTPMLDEFLLFFGLNTGSKHLRGWSFFRSHSETFVVNSVVKFASTGQVLSLQSVEILKEKMTLELSSGVSFRLGRDGDIYKSKSLHKFYISEKIPVFFRKHLLVGVGDSNLVAALCRRRYLEDLGRL